MSEFKGTKGKWVLDEDMSCIRCNDIPILEGSFYKKDCEYALKLASKALEMLEMLNKCADYFLNIPNNMQAEENAEAILQLIKEATE